MAHFYCNIQGSRGEATRMGTPNSGITAHPRGWHVGVRVTGEVDRSTGDTFTVEATAGSGYGSSHQIAKVVEESGVRTVTLYARDGSEVAKYDLDEPRRAAVQS